MIIKEKSDELFVSVLGGGFLFLSSASGDGGEYGRRVSGCGYLFFKVYIIR